MYSGRLGNIHHRNVARFLNTLLNRDKSVAARVMAVNLMSADFKISTAVVCFVTCYLATVKADGNSKRLRDRSGLICIGYAEIFPESLKIGYFLLIKFGAVAVVKLISSFLRDIDGIFFFVFNLFHFTFMFFDIAVFIFYIFNKSSRIRY